jgi:hypothetical protein
MNDTGCRAVESPLYIQRNVIVVISTYDLWLLYCITVFSVILSLPGISKPSKAQHQMHANIIHLQCFQP